MKNREYKHKHSCNNERRREYDYKLYRFIRAHNGWSDWEMNGIEEIECNDRNEARRRERYWVETLGSELNDRRPTLTQDEQKDYKKDYNKEYYQAHKEKFKEHNKQYYESHKKRKST